MGKPISEEKKAEFLKRAEARLSFAMGLPATDIKRDTKIKEAERALKTAHASKVGPVQKAKRPGRKPARKPGR